MYALAISGSPRKGGNTELLLKEVLTEMKDAGWETELEKVGGTAIRGCIACEKCFENKDNKCSIELEYGLWTKQRCGHFFRPKKPYYSFPILHLNAQKPGNSNPGFFIRFPDQIIE